MDYKIRLAGLSKRFRLYRRPVDRLLAWAGLSAECQDFWALRGIDLEVPAGRTLGIVGPNGAGKSTLLKIVTGTLVPTEGTVEVSGRVAALLELGTGFHPEFTGRQNIHVNGQLLGLGAEEIRTHEQAIIEFSELGPFIDQPLRTYSSGMVVRLGFAIAASVDPQVLIVDEALAVGDARFSQKCIRRIREFREQGCTILFVSHDATAVSTLCDEAVLLDQGLLVERGSPADVLERYGALIAGMGTGNRAMTVSRSVSNVEETAGRPHRFGTFQALVTGLELRNERGEEAEIFVPGTAVSISIEVLFLAEVDKPTIGFLIRDRFGSDVFGTNTALQEISLGSFKRGERVHVSVRLPVQFGDGDYSLTVAVHRDETHLEECFDWSDRMAVFSVRSATKNKTTGQIRLDTEWETQRLGSSSAPAGEALESVFSQVPDRLLPNHNEPAPFLAGFYPVENTADGVPFRWAARRGAMVIRPRFERLLLALGLPPQEEGEREATVELFNATGESLGTAKVRGERGLAEFALPGGMTGRACLVELAVDAVWREPADSDGEGRELGFALYGLRTLAPGEAHPSWDVMTVNESSATSSAS